MTSPLSGLPAMERERLRAADSKYPLVKPGHANPKIALDQLGEPLVALLLNIKKHGDLVRELYKRYLVSCERFGVEPIARKDR